MNTANYPVLPQDWSQLAEVADFDATNVGSCWHYICENSFGFSSTHPGWTEEKWVKPLVEACGAYHGPEALQSILTAVALMGLCGGKDLPWDEDAAKATDVLMKLAIVQSEYHRGVRK